MKQNNPASWQLAESTRYEGDFVNSSAYLRNWMGDRVPSGSYPRAQKAPARQSTAEVGKTSKTESKTSERPFLPRTAQTDAVLAASQPYAVTANSDWSRTW